MFSLTYSGMRLKYVLGLRDRVIGSDEKMGQDCW
jgi:hypothetical protein